MKQLNRTVCSIVMATLTISGLVGCETSSATKAQAGGVRSDVTDIRPIEPAVQAAYQPPLYDTSGTIPVAPQPMMTEAPAVDTSVPVNQTTTLISTSNATAHTTHVVRRGETLFSIAKAAYGNGKAWHRIAAANRGISASKLRVGQKLILP